MREVTPEDRDSLAKVAEGCADAHWDEWSLEISQSSIIFMKHMRKRADRIIADGWRLLPTRSELESLEWTTFIAGDVNDEIYHHLDSSAINYMIEVGLAREDPT